MTPLIQHLAPPEIRTRTTVISASFNRPANTTTYAAGDVIGALTAANVAIEFESAARSDAGTGLILAADLVDGANQALALDAELWIFDTAPTDFGNDNEAFTPTDAQLAQLVAIVAFEDSYIGDATAGAGGNRVFIEATLNRLFQIPAGTSLFGVLIARNAYVPVSAESFNIRLQIAQD